jgi:hypothetical protein
MTAITEESFTNRCVTSGDEFVRREYGREEQIDERVSEKKDIFLHRRRLNSKYCCMDVKKLAVLYTIYDIRSGRYGTLLEKSTFCSL